MVQCSGWIGHKCLSDWLIPLSLVLHLRLLKSLQAGLWLVHGRENQYRERVGSGPIAEKDSSCHQGNAEEQRQRSHMYWSVSSKPIWKSRDGTSCTEEDGACNIPQFDICVKGSQGSHRTLQVGPAPHPTNADATTMKNNDNQWKSMSNRIWRSYGKMDVTIKLHAKS